jgi:hypothetical protein
VNEGQLSPDGQWRWDGTTWVPSGQVASLATPPRRSFAWVWWLAGGCAVLVVVAIVAGAEGLGSLVNNFQHGGFTCLPSDFPAYPGTTVAGENTRVGTGIAPGDNHECQMTLESNDSVSTVTDWYASHLDSGDWAASADVSSGVIHFQRRSRSATKGSIQLLGRGQHTEIQITLDS